MPPLPVRPQPLPLPDPFSRVLAVDFPGGCFQLGIRCGPRQDGQAGEVLQVLQFLPGGEIFPQATTSSPLTQRVEAALCAWIEDPAYDLAALVQPREARGTPYQQRVWAAIAAIPRGQTRSYGDLAEHLGSAPRAVGQACGANPLPLVVPCHRVISRSGTLGGFAHHGEGWLLRLKAWLLDRERD